jgi:ligand-binding sensor domain-containing protein/signal transduction histidine kinase
MRMYRSAGARLGALLAAIVLLALAPVYAQARPPASPQAVDQGRLSFRTLDVAEGLPHHGVYGITQDRYGFMWFGTLDGLARFDGQSFDVFRADPDDPNTPTSNVIWELYADREGVIWAGTLNSGLVRYDPRTERFTRYRRDPANPASLSSDAVRSIYQDSSGALWVGTLAGGLNRLDPATGHVTRYRHDPLSPNSLSHDRVEALADDGNGGLWVGTFGGLDRLDPASGRFTHYPGDTGAGHAIRHGAVNALLRDRHGDLWVGVDQEGLYRIEASNQDHVHYHNDPADPSSLSDGNVTAIVEDDSGNLWVATYGGGLNLFDPARDGFQHFRDTLPPEQGLRSDTIVSLFPSSGGQLWAGTGERGVTLIDQQAKAFQFYHANPDATLRPDRLRAGGIRSTVEDSNGRIWAGIAGVGLDRLDRSSGRVTHYRHEPGDPSTPISNRPQAMLVDRDGNLWIGYQGGLDRYDRASDSFVHHRNNPDDLRSLSYNDIYDLAEDSAGNLWIATRGGGLDRYDRASDSFVHHRNNPDDPYSISSDSVFSVVEDHNGVLWVGTEDAGLNRYDPSAGAFIHYSHDPGNPSSLGSNTVAVLFVDSGGTLWAATWDSGLDRYDPATDSFVRYRLKDDVLNTKLNGIQEDREGNLWLSSNLGLTKFDPRSGATTRFTSTSAGLPYGGFPLGSSAITRDGEILLGGIDSLVTFFPDQIATRAATPPVVISRFLLDNRRAAIGDSSPLATSINEVRDLTLPSTIRTLGFEFVALDFSAPGAIHYRYRLDGFDKEWIETTSDRRTATYTNLDPGRYVLRILATNGDGVWNDVPYSLRITITPPWWKTWWFILLAVLATTSLITGTFRYRLYSLHTRQAQLEAEVAARTAELTAANARLSTEVLERSRAEAEACVARDNLDRQLSIERSLIVSDNLDGVLGGILDQIGKVVAYSTAGIFTPDGDELVLRALRSVYMPRPQHELRYSRARVPQLAQALKTPEPLVFADVAVDSEMLAYLSEIVGHPVRTRSWLIVPLLAHEQVMGLLLLANTVPRYYNRSDADALESFTSPIAIALQNASLRRAAEHAAVLDERNHLARELHDAVTQTLFSANLIAEALPDVLRQSPAKASAGARDLHRLTSGALAEMRTLLLELRPKTLTEKPLGHLLQLLCKSISSRTTIPIDIMIASDCTLPAQVQLVFYRVAQEALNNIVKYSDAEHALLFFEGSPDEATLRVSDNGRGFDPTTARPDSLGLGIVRERAAAIGAELSIAAELGNGTVLTLFWRAPS